MSTILLLASIQALFLAALLFSKKTKHLSDIVLAIWLALIGLHMFIYFSYAKLQLQSTFLINLNAGFPFLQGPFLYFYVNTLTMHKARLKQSYVLHFLPYIIFLIYQLFILNSVSQSPHGHQITIHIFDLLGFFNIILLGSVPVYVVWSFLLLKKYRTRILNTFSAIEKINLNWLRYLITGMGLVWLIVIAVFVYTKYLGLNQAHDVKHLIFVAITLFVYAIGYFGFKQTTVFSDILGSIGNPKLIESRDVNESVNITESETESSGKYQKSSLKEDEARETLNRLLDHMKTEKPYLNDQLTLPQVAADLGISINHLSQIINEYCKQNFFDFVNFYRIEEVNKKLINPQYDAFSLLAIAFECGFGSKSSFNRIFKNATGKTPTQYKKGLKI